MTEDEGWAESISMNWIFSSLFVSFFHVLIKAVLSSSSFTIDTKSTISLTLALPLFKIRISCVVREVGSIVDVAHSIPGQNGRTLKTQ